MCDDALSSCNDGLAKFAVDFATRKPKGSEAACLARPTACGLEPAEPVHIDHARERRERLAAVLVIKPTQPAVTLRVSIEVDADAALSLGDGRVATGAERSLRTAAARRHWIESHKVPQIRIAPACQSHEDASVPTERWSIAVDDSTAEGFWCARWREKATRSAGNRSGAAASAGEIRWNLRHRPRDLAVVPADSARRAIA